MRFRIFLALVLVHLSLGSFVHSSPTALKYETVNERVDGLDSIYVELRGEGFVGRYFSDGNWFVAEKKDREASITFVNRFRPKVYMDLSVYPSAALIADYEEESLHKYAAGLKEFYAARNLQAENVVGIKSAVGGASLMGRAYWRVRFDVFNPQLGAVTQSVCDYISLGLDGENFRLRFRGEPEDFRLLESSFESKLFGFMQE